MNLTNLWMQSDWYKALGWTFVHSLWQIAAIGFLLYAILRLIPGRSAHIRYTISTMAFWLIVMVVLSTFIIMLPDAKPLKEITGQMILMKSTGTIQTSDRISAWLETRMPMMLSIWFGGVLLLMIRLLFSLGWVRHMRKTAFPVLSMQTTLNELIQRLQLKIRPITSESRYATSPVTIGHIKPLILFPIGIINQLTPTEVEAILAHELAHIVRRDYLSNLIQSFIETLFYYHPVTWWISNMVRTERENRADDLAVSWCGDHLGYAKALIAVEEMQLSTGPSLAIGFASRKGAMLARIQRILHLPYKNHNQMEKLVLISLCSLFFLGFTLTGHPNPGQKKESLPSVHKDEISVTVTATDSLPTKGTYRIHKKTDDQDISVEVKDGDIKELHVDGKEIARSQFNQYGKMIDELFGGMETPTSMNRFNYQMPAMPPMPPMPPMPEMPASPAMPPMPPMPPMQGMNEMEIGHVFGDGSNIKFWNNDNFVSPKIIYDTLGNPKSKIIIIGDNGDSTVMISDQMNWTGNDQDKNLDLYLRNNQDWVSHQQEWKQLSDEWKQNWKEHAEQWQQDWKEQEQQMKEQQERLRDEDYSIREQARQQMNNNSDNNRAIQEQLRSEGLGRGRGMYRMSPRMNMTDEMINEGLVQPGEEADVILTPQKLKINGKKMPDEIHKKYLQLYEDQQGVELSDNSRVEFKTKTRRSM